MPSICARVSENLASKVKEIAAERGMSVSDLIREAIMHYLELEEIEEEEERMERKAAEVPSELEERIQRIEAEIRAIWKKFEELEEEKMMEHIFQGFEEFLEQQEKVEGEG